MALACGGGTALGSDSDTPLPPEVSKAFQNELGNGVATPVGASGPITVGAGERDYRLARLPYRLSNTIHRPHPGWWIMATDIQVRLAPDSGPGEAVIGIGSNGHTWGQIEVFQRDRAGQRIDWNTLDIVRGYTEHVEHSTMFTVPVANFPSLSAVRRGVNILKMSVQEIDDIRLASVTAPKVVVLATKLVPEPLDLRVSTRDLGSVHMGDTVTVPYTIHNLNPLPLKDVIVKASDFDGVSVIPAAKRIAAVARTSRGTVQVKVNRRGRVRFTLFARNRIASSGGPVTITALPPAPSAPNDEGATWALGAAGIATLAVAAGIVALIRRRRARTA